MSRNGIVKIRDGNLAGVPYLDPFEFLVKAAAIGTFEVGKLDQSSGTCESNCGGGKGVRPKVPQNPGNLQDTESSRSASRG